MGCDPDGRECLLDKKPTGEMVFDVRSFYVSSQLRQLLSGGGGSW